MPGRLIRLESQVKLRGEERESLERNFDAGSIDALLNARTRSHRRHSNAISSFELLDSRRSFLRWQIVRELESNWADPFIRSI